MSEKFLLKVLSSFCPPHLLEEIEGDLLQHFERDVKKFGEKKAKRRLLWNVVRFFRPAILFRNKFSAGFNQLPMFQNYFKTTYRHIFKNKINFAFKLGGLTLAIFSVLVITIYVTYQLSFDTHHVDYKNIYRVNSERKENGQIEKYGYAPLAIGPLLQQHFPEVDAMARTRYWNGSYLKHEAKVASCGGLVESDSTLFRVLTFKFIKGNQDALKKPNGIVLTKTIALNLFGSTDVLGKTISINSEKTLYQVSGVIEDPTTTCFGFEAVILKKKEADLTLKSIISPVEFLDNATTLFVRFKHPITADFESKVKSMLDKFIKPSDQLASGFKLSFEPIKDIYHNPPLKFEFVEKGNPVYLYAFSVLGILLLVVAAINYINLSIADLNGRSRETGVRKVLGASKIQIVSQVGIETITFCALALGLGLILVYLLFPKIIQLLDSHLRLEMLFTNGVITIVSLALLLLLFFSTYFPARELAVSKVSQNLKSSSGSYNSTLSKGLLFVQFAISIICICCTLVIGKQIQFIHNKDLGIDRKNLLLLSTPEDFSVQKMQMFKQEIKNTAGVTAVSNSSFVIGGGYWKDWYTVEDNGKMKNVELYEVFSDDDLFATLGIKILKGRTFNSKMPTDSGAAFVINETAAKELGWDDPIGKRIFTHPEEKGKWDGIVVGMVNDININSLYTKVRPLVMRLPWQRNYPEYFVYVRYAGDAKPIIQAIEKKYKELMPGYALDYQYVDELYNSRHQKENKAFTSLQLGTSIIILVSLIGIFSLSIFLSVKRMKEFGIRKVLGATVQQIASLHISYFLRILALSNILALPIAYWLAKEWLDGFAYRTNLSSVLFFAVAGMSVFIVIFTAGYSALKAGRMNPVDVIKMD